MAQDVFYVSLKHAKRVMPADSLKTSSPSQAILCIYRIRNFMAVFTTAYHLFLSPARCSPRTAYRTTLMLSSHLLLGLPNGLFPSGFPPKLFLHAPLLKPTRASCVAHLIRDVITLVFGGENRPWRRYEVDGTAIESRSARFYAPVQTCPGGHPASYTTGTALFPGGKEAGAWR